MSSWIYLLFVNTFTLHEHIREKHKKKMSTIELLLLTFSGEHLNEDGLIDNPSVSIKLLELIYASRSVSEVKGFNSGALAKFIEELRLFQLTPGKVTDWRVFKETPITVELIKKYPQIGWNMSAVSRIIDWKDIVKNPDMRWHSDKYKNPSLTLDIIINNPNYPWDFDSISANPNLTWDFVLSRPREKWNLYYLHKNKCVTPEIVNSGRNPVIAFWNWNYLCENPNFTFDILSKADLQTSGIVALSKNPNVTPEIIEDNPEFPWDWEAISQNPSITYEFIMRHEGLISPYALCSNTFSLH